MTYILYQTKHPIGNLKILWKYKYTMYVINLKVTKSTQKGKNWPPNRMWHCSISFPLRLLSGLYFPRWYVQQKAGIFLWVEVLINQSHNCYNIAFRNWGRKSPKGRSPIEKVLKLANKLSPNSLIFPKLYMG